MDRFTLTADDGAAIACYRWAPAGTARAVVQITHGMGEHAQRYDYLAKRLNDAGYAVYAQDHRGHGWTAEAEAALGQLGPDGWGKLVADIETVRRHAVGEHPGLPFVLLGHSMGSFAVQQYLPDHSGDVTAAVLTGTAALDLLEGSIDLDAAVDLSAFNAPFAPARTDFDWLSRDETQVDAYVADPRCGFGIDSAASKAMFAAARAVADPQRLRAIRRGLPIYIAVGDTDPVTGPEMVLSNALAGRYRDAGLDVVLKSYPQARHEVFNEINRDEVIDDLLAWLDDKVPQPSA